MLLHTLIFFMFIFSTRALKCNTDEGPKEEEMKSVMMNCMRKLGLPVPGHQDTLGDGNLSMEYEKETSNDEISNNKDHTLNYRRTFVPSRRRYTRGTSHGTMSTNTGQRSQYNPNIATRFDHDSSGSREDDYSFNNQHLNNSNNTESTSDDSDDVQKKKACATHCFLEDFQMTGENGMPDRHLMASIMTRDITNKEYKNFVNESIEDCFKLIQIENITDKCEFSKNLFKCISEKGRANCDDWSEHTSFF